MNAVVQRACSHACAHGQTLLLRQRARSVARSGVVAAEALESRVCLSAAPTVIRIAVADAPISRTAAPVTLSRVTSLAIVFNADVGASLDAADLSLRNLTTGKTLPASGFALSYDPATFTGRWTFAALPTAEGTSVPDGRYIATLAAAGVADSSGTLLDGDNNGSSGGNMIFAFSRLFGDANGNGVVGSDDQAALAAVLPSTAGDGRYDARFDFDGDGTISSIDQSAQNARLNRPLPAAPPAVPTGLTATAISTSDVLLGWSAGPGDATAVRLERATASTGPFTIVGTYTAGTTFRRDTGRTAGVRYYYRLTALSPFGSSAPSATVSVLMSLAPKLKVSVTRLTLTDAVDGLAGSFKALTLTNTGTGGLLIQPGGVTIAGTGASQFVTDFGSYPLLIGAGKSATLRVRMNAAAAAETSATLRIASNDSAGAVPSIALRGLGFAGGTQGPTLQQVLDFQHVPMTIVRPDPSIGGTILGERAMPLLTKAGTGPVTIQVLGAAAAGMTAANVISFGWYEPPAPAAPGALPNLPTYNPLYTIPGADATSVAPGISGSLSFDPGGDAFGLFADWPGLIGRRSWTQDELNTFEPSGNARRKIRFYPLKAGDGSTVANAYLVTAEATSVLFPRTVTMIVRNVRHASLPVGWQSQDIGPTVMAGGAGVVGTGDGASSANWTVKGGGVEQTRTADALHFAYRTLAGDGDLIARVTNPGTPGTAAGAGLTLRASLDPAAPHATVELTANGDIAFASRTAAGAEKTVTTIPTAVAPGTPAWLRIKRTGDTFTGFWSTDGVTWTLAGYATLIPSLSGAPVLTGLAVTSRDDLNLSTATFDSVRLTPVSAAGKAAVPPKVIAPAIATGTVTISAIGSDAATSGRLVIDGVLTGPKVFGGGPYVFSWNSLAVAGGSHVVGVETTDRFGNTSRATVTITVSNPDLAPETWFPTLGQGSVLSGVTTLTAAATDERGVVNVTYKVDGVQVGSSVFAAPYAMAWNTAGVADGWHSVTVTAKDTAGHLTTSLPVRVRIANRAVPTSQEVNLVQIATRRTETAAWNTTSATVIPQGVRLGAPAPKSRFGGDTAQNVGATGYFRAQKVNGRWWLVDPDGYLYFDNSVIDVDENIFPNNQADFTAKFGDGSDGTDPNANWANWVRGWLQDIGMYTAGWTQKATLQQNAPMNYTLVLQLMSSFAKSIGAARSGSGNSTFLNGTIPVFDPAFADYCNNFFTNVFPVKYPGLNPQNDPNLVGYMTDNELPWSTSTLDNYLNLPAGDPNRLAAESWVRARGVQVPTDADRTDFLSYVADTYFRVTSSAIRAYDPNHMILGARLLSGDGQKPYLYKAAKPYIDVATINYYDGLSPGSVLTKTAVTADMPFMVSEFYAKGVDSGLANRAGFGLTVRTQADRGAYYQSVALSLLASKNAVGLSWLSLMDNNESNAKADPSNTDANKGLMPINYPLTQAENPYAPLTSRIADINANLYELIRRLTA